MWSSSSSISQSNNCLYNVHINIELKLRLISNMYNFFKKNWYCRLVYKFSKFWSSSYFTHVQNMSINLYLHFFGWWIKDKNSLLPSWKSCDDSWLINQLCVDDFFFYSIHVQYIFPPICNYNSSPCMHFFKIQNFNTNHVYLYLFMYCSTL